MPAFMSYLLKQLQLQTCCGNCPSRASTLVVQTLIQSWLGHADEVWKEIKWEKDSVSPLYQILTSSGVAITRKYSCTVYKTGIHRGCIKAVSL